MQTEATVTNGTGIAKPQLVQEIYRGELCEYYPLGQYIVAAPGVCGGRPPLLEYISLSHTYQALRKLSHISRSATSSATSLTRRVSPRCFEASVSMVRQKGQPTASVLAPVASASP